MSTVVRIETYNEFETWSQYIEKFNITLKQIASMMLKGRPVLLSKY